MLRSSRRPWAVLVSVALLCWLGMSSGSAGVSPRCDDPRSRALPAPAGSVAVVLSHGWTGSMTGLVDMRRELERDLPGISVYVFDYGRLSDTWPSNPAIAACLAEFIRNVSTLNNVPVVYAAHSMGGLAVRYASDPKYAGAAALTSEHLAEVITVDTPHRGSPWGGRQIASVLEFLQMLVNHGALPRQGRDAARCLSDKRPCDPPPWLPAGTNITMLSGDTRIERTYFGLWPYTIPMGGDGIVLDASMSGYANSGPPGVARPQGRIRFVTVSCTQDSGEATRRLSRLTPPVGDDVFSEWARAFGDASAWDDINAGKLTMGSGALWGVATMTADCSHRTIMNQPETRRTIIDVVKRAQTTSAAKHPDILASGVCGEGAIGSGATTFRHPTWGQSTFMTCQPGSGPGTVGAAVFDGQGSLKWKHRIDGNYYQYSVAQPGTDASGNIFINYNPGRYSGIAVVTPVTNSMELRYSYEGHVERFSGRVPPVDRLALTGYYAELTGPGSDGLYRIEQFHNDCTPSCAGGTTTSQIYVWNGSDYEPQDGPTALGSGTCDVTRIAQDIGDTSAQDAEYPPELVRCDGSWAIFQTGWLPQHWTMVRWTGATWDTAFGFPTSTCRADFLAMGGSPAIAEIPRWNC